MASLRAKTGRFQPPVTVSRTRGSGADSACSALSIRSASVFSLTRTSMCATALPATTLRRLPPVTT
ncbi:hypothetical protein ABT317_25420, partial [Streptomyces carpinensis]